MQDNDSVVSRLISNISNLRAQYDDINDFYDRAREAVDHTYLVIHKSEIPKVSESDPHYHYVGHFRVPRTVSPADLRKDALAMLAIADLRDKEIDAENEELASYRIAAIEEMYAPYYSNIDKYTYLSLTNDQKRVIDAIVDLRIQNDEMKFRLDSLDK